MPDKSVPPLLIQNAEILFRNFSGEARPFNSEGDRNFSVKLNPDLAQKLKAEGWRVKQLKPREEGLEGDYHLKVNVNFKTNKPPRVVLIGSNGPTELGVNDIDEINIIDAADIAKVDVLINGYWSDMAGGGYSGFLKSIFVTLDEDELEQMYANILNGNAEKAAAEEAEEKELAEVDA
jgi:hypothetical protein